MLCRRVPVFRLGSRGPGGDQNSLRLCLQAFASGKGCRASLAVKNGRETQNCRDFLDFAVQKCQQSPGSGGVLVAKRRIFHFWGRVWSSHPKSLHGHMDRGVLVVKSVIFGLVFGRRMSKVPTVTGIGGVLAAKRRPVVTLGLAFRRRIPEVPTVTGIAGVLVAKRRTVVPFGLAFGRRIGDRKGESRGERRQARGQEKGEERGDRRQERGDRRGERREKRRERRERDGERGEKGETRGEMREEKREERRGER